MSETYAPAVLKRVGRQWSWVIRKCPRCGEKHVHGGGLVGQDNPENFLSRRAVHCFSHGYFGSGSYVLVRDPEGDHDDVEEAEAIIRRREAVLCTR